MCVCVCVCVCVLLLSLLLNMTDKDSKMSNLSFLIEYANKKICYLSTLYNMCVYVCVHVCVYIFEEKYEQSLLKVSRKSLWLSDKVNVSFY